MRGGIGRELGFFGGRGKGRALGGTLAGMGHEQARRMHSPPSAYLRLELQRAKGIRLFN
jgi:hypothetical protein